MPKLQFAENRRHGNAGRGQAPEEQRMNMSNETNSLAQAGDFFFSKKVGEESKTRSSQNNLDSSSKYINMIIRTVI